MSLGVACLACFLLAASSVTAQPQAEPPASPSGVSQMTGDSPSNPAADAPRGWTLDADGALFGTFNRQGGRRGDTQFRSQNWLMLMGSRRLGVGTFTATGMMTAEPFTVGPAGYLEIFQVGEAYRGLPVTDHQHPHDLVMQLSAAWRIALGRASSFTVAGGPVGEATLGPVAFMHSPSAGENPTAPVSHHIFDSTHLVNGVAMVARGRLEARQRRGDRVRSNPE